MLQKKTPWLIVFILLVACGGSERDLRFINLRGQVFGTFYSVSYYCPDGKNYKQEIDSIFNVINQSMSYYIPTSVISRVNRNETDSVDEHFAIVLRRSLEIAAQTEGAFDPTIGPLVNAWGFGFERRKDMTSALIDSLKRKVGYERVQLVGQRVIKEIPEIQFDFNAIAKGYASDVVGDFLASKGVETYMVEIGGDLVARGLKPDGSAWRIGLERPAENEAAPQHWDYLVEMHNRAVATSGSTRKYYEEGGQRFSHTIDPKTGKPVMHNLLSVSVFADDCMTADAFATAFMVMGMEKAKSFLEQQPNLDAFFIFDEGNQKFGTWKSEGIAVVPREEIERNR